MHFQRLTFPVLPKFYPMFHNGVIQICYVVFFVKMHSETFPIDFVLAKSGNDSKFSVRFAIHYNLRHAHAYKLPISSCTLVLLLTLGKKLTILIQDSWRKST